MRRTNETQSHDTSHYTIRLLIWDRSACGTGVHSLVHVIMLFSCTSRQGRKRHQLTKTRTTRSVLDAAPSRIARPHPVVAIRDDSLGDPLHEVWEQDTGFEDNKDAEAGDAFRDFDFITGGPAEQLFEEETPTAFDGIRAQMHAEFWRCLPANSMMFQGRKEAAEISLQTAIAAHCSQCPRCNSTDCQTQGPAVTVLWVGSSYRFELAVPRSRCCTCQFDFSLNPLQLGCLPATAVQGWDLTKVAFGGRPVWFDLQLLQVWSSTQTLPL